jgi:hypothetical protein
LQAISGISELMMKSPPQDDQLFEKLRLISEQVEKMGNITRKLMRIMKYETKEYFKRSRIIDIDKALAHID